MAALTVGVNQVTTIGTGRDNVSAAGRRGCRRIAFAALLALLCLGMAEVLFRAAGFVPALPLDRDKPSVQAYFWVSDPQLGFRNRPNGRYRYDLMRGEPLITTDAMGFRNGFGWDPDADTPVVLFVGDSTTFCAEVNDGETYPSEVARQLEDAGVRVLNAGVRGYNTVQAKRMIARCLSSVGNIAVVVYCFCGNDLEENLDPAAHHPARAPVVARDPASGDFVERDVDEPVVPWGRNFADWSAGERRARIARIRAKRWDRRLRDRVREHSAFVNALYTAVDRRRRRERPAAGAPPPAEATAVGTPRAGDVPRDAFRMLLREMQELCAEHGARFAVTRFARRELSAPVAAWCSEAGVVFLPGHAQLPRHDLSYRARTRDGGYDGHYGPRGTRAFARALAPSIRELLTDKPG